MNTVAGVALAIAGSAVLVQVAAQPLRSAHPAAGVVADRDESAGLESVFWMCDYAATTGRLDTGTSDACSSNLEEVKYKKFGGNFSALVDWWRRHKVVQHQTQKARLAAGARLN